MYGQVVPFVGGLQRFQGGDAGGFNQLAVTLDMFQSAAGVIRQNRIGYIVLGWLADRLLKVASFGALDFEKAKPPLYSEAEYGFLLINALILSIGLLALWSLVRPHFKQNWGLLLFASLLLVANPVTRAYFWTAHTQMLNLVIPLLAVALAARFAQSPPSIRGAVAIGLGIGLAVTVYASIALVGGTIAVLLVIKRAWRQAVAVVCLMGIPTGAWVAFTSAVTGSYHSEETQQWRQFVWVLDALADGSLLARVRANVNALMVSFADAQTVFAVGLTVLVLALILTALLWGPIQNAPELASQRDRSTAQTQALAVFVVAQCLFLYFMGYYQNRLSWGLVASAIVTVVVLGGWATTDHVTPQWSLRVNASAAFVSVVWLVSWYAIPGPWV